MEEKSKNYINTRLIEEICNEKNVGFNINILPSKYLDSRKKRFTTINLIEKLCKEKNISLENVYKIIYNITKNYDYFNAKLLINNCNVREFSDKQIIDIYNDLLKIKN